MNDTTGPRRRPRGWRLWAFRLAGLGLVVLILEGACGVTILALNRRPGRPILRAAALYQLHGEGLAQAFDPRPESLGEFHPTLGWRTKANLVSRHNVINSWGLRSPREYSEVPPDGTLRVAAHGDSFVYGSEVLGDECWSSIIERENADIEVLNYGVPGYGTDQAYLRYVEEGRRGQPQVVVLGITPDRSCPPVNCNRRT